MTTAEQALASSFLFEDVTSVSDLDEEDKSELPLHERLALFLKVSPVGVYMDIFQVVLSVLASVLYIVSTYERGDCELLILRGDYDPVTSTSVNGTVTSTSLTNTELINERCGDPEWIFPIEIVLAVFFSLDFMVHFYIAPSRFWYLMSPFAFVDFFTVVPVFIEAFGGFETANLGFMRIVLILRVLRILRSYRLMFLPANSVAREATVLGFIVVSLIFCAAGIIQVVEYSTGPVWQRQYWPFHDALYFIVISFSTVGYGDLSPETGLGKLVMCLLIIAAVVLIPMQTNRVVQIIAMQSKYAGAYAVDESFEHVVVIGDIVDNKMGPFFQEFFHDDHDRLDIKIVLLGSDEVPSEALKRFIAVPQYDGRIVYYHGSALNDEDLARVALDRATACFVLTDDRTSDAVAADKATILRALACKQFEPHVDLYSQVLNPGNVPFLHTAQAKEVFCLHEMKLKLLAMGLRCPGALTLISNLVSSAGAIGRDMPEWLQQYGHGKSLELYRTKLPAAFSGMTFSVAAAIVYTELGATLLGLEIPRSRGHIALNPSRYVVVGGETAFLICGDSTVATQLRNYAIGGNYRNHHGLQIINVGTDRIKAEFKGKLVDMTPRRRPGTPKAPRPGLMNVQISSSSSSSNKGNQPSSNYDSSSGYDVNAASGYDSGSKSTKRNYSSSSSSSSVDSILSSVSGGDRGYSGYEDTEVNLRIRGGGRDKRDKRVTIRFSGSDSGGMYEDRSQSRSAPGVRFAAEHVSSFSEETEEDEGNSARARGGHRNRRSTDTEMERWDESERNSQGHSRDNGVANGGGGSSSGSGGDGRDGDVRRSGGSERSGKGDKGDRSGKTKDKSKKGKKKKKAAKDKRSTSVSFREGTRGGEGSGKGSGPDLTIDTGAGTGVARTGFNGRSRESISRSNDDVALPTPTAATAGNEPVLSRRMRKVSLAPARHDNGPFRLYDAAPDHLDNIIVICGFVEDIAMLIAPLRAEYIKTLQPIVVLHEPASEVGQNQRIFLSVAEHVHNEFAHVYFVQGDPLDLEALQAAGLARASSCMILNNGRLGDMSDPLVDADSILASMEVTSKFNLLNPGLFCITELLHAANTKFLKPASEEKINSKLFSLLPAYAAGRVFSASMIDSAIIQSFYNDGLGALLDLVMTGENSMGTSAPDVPQSYLFQIMLAEKFVGQPYIELFHHLTIKCGVLPLGLLRNPIHFDSPAAFVCTSPTMDSVCNSGDRVFVLAQSDSEPGMELAIHGNGVYTNPKFVDFNITQLTINK